MILNDFNLLLNNNDKLKKLSKIQKLDLIDYVNMRERNLPCIVKWNSIRSNIVTKNGDTLWQLSEKYLNSSFRAIGILELPSELIKWVLQYKLLTPRKIEDGEWWFKGCFIQKQNYPTLKPYYVFKDTEKQETVDSCFTFAEAKKLCNLNEVKNYKLGYKSFI